MESLFRLLQKYNEQGLYPCHMPGHKGCAFGELPEEFARIDGTEVPGLDNLHDAQGILLDAQRNAARLTGGEESFFLVGGSTAGVLAAISAAVPEKGKLLLARGSHLSAYHAAYLRRLRLHYLYGEPAPDGGYPDAVSPEEVQRGLETYPETDAVFLVSPTYEGRIADIRRIAELVHERGIPLIVDEAHGAHLGWAEGYAENSNRQGADLVVQSLHKTLPAPTQTAVLHVNGARVDRGRLRRFLRIYQSSSPSYPLLAGIDNAFRGMEAEGKQLLGELRKHWDAMLTELARCEVLRFPGNVPAPEERMSEQGNPEKDRAEKRSAQSRGSAASGQDIGKLVISGIRGGISGGELAERLREGYGIETEMASVAYCLAMFTVADPSEGFTRVAQALLSLDRELAERAQNPESDVPRNEIGRRVEKLTRVSEMIRGLYGRDAAPAVCLDISSGWDAAQETARLVEAEGRICADFVGLYPPGIPFLVPGERIGVSQLRGLRELLALGFPVQGIRMENEDGEPRIAVAPEGFGSI